MSSHDNSAAAITRRCFARLAGAGLLAAALPMQASSKLDIGIGTYSYHNLSMDDMIVQLNALHVSEIEMSRGEFMLMNHPGDDLFHSARSKLDAAGIRCVSYYSATVKDDQGLENSFALRRFWAPATSPATPPAAFSTALISVFPRLA